ncbi:Bug family tripartite tricarboxylate transporter substrate binding protein [Roseomonas fluvialis]|uniref:ABC transporter substrate-binding protein n=1 Tax=Roseomonas fluvialis TaxID=1750527 RepID=A0ABM7Y8E9_9PROT|nr:tripartite tricarboxylate transporter substrate binding protein [Roseomonas fluvialis]BDG74309.1 ABC transporter substrate-binding protein [Roseomonas fluvialis]
MLRRRHLLTCLPLFAAPRGVSAQFLSGGRPLRLMVPFNPGGAADVLARHYAEAITSQTGQQVVVENRGAANGILAVEAVARSASDGSTLGVLSVTFFAALPFMMDRPPYDPVRDLMPVARIANSTVLCVVTPERARERGWTDFRSMIEWAKRPSNRVTTGSARATPSHLISATIASRSGADIQHIPYRGGAPAVSDFLAGTIDMIFDAMPQLMPHVAAGRAVPLAVGSRERSPFFPQVPGMGEFADLNLAAVDLQSWSALAGPSSMAPATVAQLFEGIRKAGEAPGLEDRLKASGLVLSVSSSPAEVQTQIQQDTPRWREMVAASGARLD